MAQAKSLQPAIVLTISEVLENIFAYLDKSTARNCALVCTTWSTPALDALWCEVDGAFDLFYPLNVFSDGDLDLNQRKASEVAMIRDPEESGWSRWEQYARRVKRFRYGDDLLLDRNLLGIREKGPTCTMISDSCWDRVGRTHPDVCLLPNLVHLEWSRGLKHPINSTHGQLQACIRLFSPSLKTMVVGVRSAESDVFITLLNGLCARCPLLEALDLRTQLAISTWDERSETKLMSNLMARHLNAFINLRKLTLPAFWLNTLVAESLAELPNLQVLQYELFFPERKGSPEDVINFRPTLLASAYPALTEFALAASAPDITSFFTAPHHPSNIVDLFLHSPNELPTVKELSGLLLALSRSCPRMYRLNTDFCLDRPIPDAVSSLTTPTLQDIVAIQSMPYLEFFELYYQYPLDATEDGVADFISRLPRIQHIILNCEPFKPARSYNQLAVLSAIAQRRPQLKFLGILLEARLDNATEAGCILLPPTATFPRPMELQVGPSRIDAKDMIAVAEWLSDLCPHGCKIMSGYSWKPTTIVLDWDPSSPAIWSQVNDVIKLLTKVKARERQLRQALEDEVSELRTRVAEKESHMPVCSSV